MNLLEVLDRLALPVFAAAILVFLFWEGETEKECVKRLDERLDEDTEISRTLIKKMVGDPDFWRDIDIFSIEDIYAIQNNSNESRMVLGFALSNEEFDACEYTTSLGNLIHDPSFFERFMK